MSNPTDREVIPVPEVVDVSTGVVLPFWKAKPKQIAEFIKSKQPKELSLMLTDVNAYASFFKKLEKGIKDRIREEIITRKLEFDDHNHLFYEDWRMTKIPGRRFSETLLMETGTPEEKAAYTAIKEKYSVESETIKFGG